ncbi:hypothetical protein LCGC14_3124420, partial [marine sediment metagenome]
PQVMTLDIKMPVMSGTEVLARLSHDQPDICIIVVTAIADVSSAVEHPESPATIGNEGVLATPIGQIELSVRARRALERLGVKTLGELAAKTEAELLACRNFGQTSLNEVVQRLGEYGLAPREST